MVFNGDSNGQDLCTLCDDEVNTSVTLYPLTEKTRSANKTLREVWSWIFDAYGGWEYDDSNNSNLPIATADINVNQLDYDVPTTSLTIRAVEILPQNGTVFQHLEEITEEWITERGLSEASLFTSTGMPRYYRPIGNSIKIYPAANYSQTASLRVTFDRGSSAFLPSDTTKQPGFASEFHEVIAFGMAREYARRNGLTSFNVLENEMNKFERRIKDYYSSKFKEKFPSRINVFDATSDYL